MSEYVYKKEIQEREGGDLGEVVLCTPGTARVFALRSARFAAAPWPPATPRLCCKSIIRTPRGCFACCWNDGCVRGWRKVLGQYAVCNRHGLPAIARRAPSGGGCTHRQRDRRQGDCTESLSPARSRLYGGSYRDQGHGFLAAGLCRQ